MNLAVGPVALEVEALSPWDAALEALADGFGPARRGALPATPPYTLRILLRTPHDKARPPRPRSPPRWTAESATHLVDHSEVWDAVLMTGARSAVATFDIRTTRTEPHVHREIVSAALRVALATVAPLANAVLVHGAALVEGARGAVFMGPSGEGKTTMARRLPGWRLLADDACLVTAELVCGTPLRGKEGLPRSAEVAPLAALIELAKGSPELALTPLTPAELAKALVPRIFWYASVPALEAVLMDVVQRIVTRVPGFRLASSLAHDITPVLTDKAPC